MSRKTRTLFVAALLCSVAAAPGVLAQESMGEPGHGSGKKNPLKNVYFGEQHLHTQASPDAFAVGTRGTWSDAYDYALGKEVKLSQPVRRLRRTLPMTSSPSPTMPSTSMSCRR